MTIFIIELLQLLLKILYTQFEIALYVTHFWEYDPLYIHVSVQ